MSFGEDQIGYEKGMRYFKTWQSADMRWITAIQQLNARKRAGWSTGYLIPNLDEVALSFAHSSHTHTLPVFSNIFK